MWPKKFGKKNCKIFLGQGFFGFLTIFGVQKWLWLLLVVPLVTLKIIQKIQQQKNQNIPRKIDKKSTNFQKL